ncbi:hypothetical protein RCL1_003662 [Eukaryota sp. TZLM3-RCL]
MQEEFFNLFSYCFYKLKALACNEPSSCLPRDELVALIVNEAFAPYQQRSLGASHDLPLSSFIDSAARFLALVHINSEKKLETSPDPQLLAPILTSLSNLLFSHSHFLHFSPMSLLNTHEQIAPFPIHASSLTSSASSCYSTLCFPSSLNSPLPFILDSLKKSCLTHSKLETISQLESLIKYSSQDLAASSVVIKVMSVLQVVLTTYLTPIRHNQSNNHSFSTCPSLLASQLYLRIALIASHDHFSEFLINYCQHLTLIHAKLISSKSNLKVNNCLESRVPILLRLLIELPSRWIFLEEKILIQIFDSVASFIKPQSSSESSWRTTSLLLSQSEERPGSWIENWFATSSFVVTNGSFTCRHLLIRSLIGKKVISSCLSLISDSFPSTIAPLISFSTTLIALFIRYCPANICPVNKSILIDSLIGLRNRAQIDCSILTHVDRLIDKLQSSNVSIMSSSLNLKQSILRLSINHESDIISNRLVSIITDQSSTLINQIFALLSCFPSASFNFLNYLTKSAFNFSSIFCAKYLNYSGFQSFLINCPLFCFFLKSSSFSKKLIGLEKSWLNFDNSIFFLDVMTSSTTESIIFDLDFLKDDFNSFLFVLCFIKLYPVNSKAIVESIIFSNFNRIIQGLYLVFNQLKQSNVSMMTSFLTLFDREELIEDDNLAMISQHTSDCQSFLIDNIEMISSLIVSFLPPINSLILIYGSVHSCLFQVNQILAQKLVQNGSLKMIVFFVFLSSSFDDFDLSIKPGLILNLIRKVFNHYLMECENLESVFQNFWNKFFV